MTIEPQLLGYPQNAALSPSDIRSSLDNNSPFCLRDLPFELQGMVLENLVLKIDKDEQEVLKRWSYQNPVVGNTQKTAAPIEMIPQLYHTNVVLHPGYRLSSKVKVTLNPRGIDLSQRQADEITVLIPRRWIEFLYSGVFRDSDLAFFGRLMDIEITSSRTKLASYLQHGPDTLVESTIRELLKRKKQLKVQDSRIHAIHLLPYGLNNFLPHLQTLQIVHRQPLTWLRRTNNQLVEGAFMVDLCSVRSITFQEVDQMNVDDELLHGLIEALRRHDSNVTPAARRYSGTTMSLKQTEKHLVKSGWANRAQYAITIKCIAGGLMDWWSSILISIELILEYRLDDQTWSLFGVTVKYIDDRVQLGDLWATRVHFDTDSWSGARSP